MAKKYVVTLEVEEREQLLALIGSGNAKARTLTHARDSLESRRRLAGPDDLRRAECKHCQH